MQQEFASLLYALHDVALRDDKQTLLFLDPMHQIHNNENEYCWQLKGKKNTKTVKANSGRRRLNIIGALNPVNLEPTILLTEENCTEEVIHALLYEIKEQYASSDYICIVLDNARYQRAYSVLELASHLNIQLLYLPPYCPNLNLIERLWKYFKKKVMKNKYYENFKDFESAITKFFVDYDQHLPDLKTLLNYKFGIIKAC